MKRNPWWQIAKIAIVVLAGFAYWSWEQGFWP